jgi:hypothetical protein
MSLFASTGPEIMCMSNILSVYGKVFVTHNFPFSPLLKGEVGEEWRGEEGEGERERESESE